MQAFTGLRLSELRGLAWANVDITKGVIHVVQRADYRGVMGPTKSRAGNRTVPLTPMAKNTLRQWRLACPKTESDLVFPNAEGKPILGTNVHRQMWRPLLRALSLEDSGIVFHSLRHVCASMLSENGAQPKWLQTVMGHSSIKVTYDVCGHLWASPENDAAAIAQAENRFFS